MTHLRNRYISPAKLRRLRSALYRKLHKEAFDNYFECCKCGGHKDLESHHLAYDPDQFDNPLWYRIECRECHKLHRHK